jgi:hypothetical protein
MATPILEAFKGIADNRSGEGTGIESSSPYSWSNSKIVRAWITAGDGNWGFDEIFHLSIEYTNGRKLHLSDYAEDDLFHKAEAVLEYYLKIKIDWRGPVWGAYQRYKAQSWAEKALTLWKPHKLIVYTRSEAINQN